MGTGVMTFVAHCMLLDLVATYVYDQRHLFCLILANSVDLREENVRTLSINYVNLSMIVLSQKIVSVGFTY